MSARSGPGPRPVEVTVQPTSEVLLEVALAVVALGAPLVAVLFCRATRRATRPTTRPTTAARAGAPAGPVVVRAHPHEAARLADRLTRAGFTTVLDPADETLLMVGPARGGAQDELVRRILTRSVA